jgi:hypothetical protein
VKRWLLKLSVFVNSGWPKRRLTGKRPAPRPRTRQPDPSPSATAAKTLRAAERAWSGVRARVEPSTIRLFGVLRADPLGLYSTHQLFEPVGRDLDAEALKLGVVINYTALDGFDCIDKALGKFRNGHERPLSRHRVATGTATNGISGGDGKTKFD